ncbi:MAG: hypothetical protein AAFS10_27910, partial [Myxococcota bacterium]
MNPSPLIALLDDLCEVKTVTALGQRLRVALVPAYADEMALVVWSDRSDAQDGVLRCVARSGFETLDLGRLERSDLFQSAMRHTQPHGGETTLEELGLASEDRPSCRMMLLRARGCDMGVLLLRGETSLLADVSARALIRRCLALALATAQMSQDLDRANNALEDAGVQMYTSERLAALGMLASGIAHEIN